MTTIVVRIEYSFIEARMEGMPGHHRYLFTFTAPQGHIEIIPIEFDAKDSRDEDTDKRAVHEFEARVFEYGPDIEWKI